MDQPGTGTQWGMAAILGCGLCCGGLLANAAWLGTTAATVGALAAGWVWVAVAGAVAAAALLVWRLRR